MLEPDDFASRRVGLTASWRRWRRVQRLWPILAVAAAAVMIANAAADSLWELFVTVAALAVFSVAVLCGVELDRRSSQRAVNTAAGQLRRLERFVADKVPGSLDAALREMAERLQDAIAADSVAVLILDGEELVLRAASGVDSQHIGLRRAVGDDLIGHVVSDGHTQSATGSALAEGPLPEFMAEMTTAAACPLWLNGVPIGALTVGYRRAVESDVADVALLEIAASRMVTTIEAARLRERERRASLGHARAREHVRMLGDSSRLLLRSVDDYERPLAEVINTVVGDFASLAAAFLADGATSPDLRVVAARLRNADIASQFSSASLDPIRDVMAAGRSRLEMLDRTIESAAALTDLDRALMDMGVTSYVVAPIQVRGLAFGALLFGTEKGVRGFRPSDHAAIDDLAQRVALAIESNLLYREAQQSAATTSRHMGRLRSLLDTKLAIGSDSSRSEILSTCARGVGQLYPDSRVILAVGAEQYDEAGQRLANPLSTAAVEVLSAGDGLVCDEEAVCRQLGEADRSRLPSAFVVVPIAPISRERGFVLIESVGTPFTAEDESLVTLLIRMMATSLYNEALNEQTRAAAARTQAIFRASPAAIVTLSEDLSVLDFNPAARELFIWDGRTERAALPPAVAAKVRSLAARTTLNDEPQQADLVLPGEAGERSLVLMLAPASTETDSDCGFVLVVTDDTERVALASQFQQAQRLEAIGRLAGGVAHDFNNLLTVIQGYADALLRRLPPADPNRERIAAIARAGSRGAALTKQLLTISRQQVVTPIVLRPTEVLDEMRGMLGKMVGESIEIQRLPGDDDVKVSISKLQLEQVLLNLAANARDAMPDGGTLLLSVHRKAGPPTTVSPSDDRADSAGWVELRVSDDGIGMDSATLARCLDPLYTTKEPGAGTGLGLSTVYGIARQNRGDVTISSAPGRGTTVSIFLPAVEEEVTEVTETALPGPLDAAARGAGTILLVEDDQEVRWMVLRLLRERGFRTLSADTGLDALDLMRERADRVDMLLTDVAMPGMSGPEVARAIRAIRPVPVLFMSGYAEKLSHAAGRHDFPAEFLAKPFTPDELIAAVQRTLRRDDRSAQLA